MLGHALSESRPCGLLFRYQVIGAARLNFLFRLQLWLSSLLLLGVYVLVITPVALLSRLFGRDPLRLRKKHWGDKNVSAWELRTASDPASYLRQY